MFWLYILVNQKMCISVSEEENSRVWVKASRALDGAGAVTQCVFCVFMERMEKQLKRYLLIQDAPEGADLISSC
jgi:hypothetical protein